MGLQRLQIDFFEDSLVGRFEDDRRGNIGLVGFQPATDTETPAVFGIQSGEVQFWPRRDQVVALGCRELQKVLGHLRTEMMLAVVAGDRRSVAVALVAGREDVAAGFEGLAQHVPLGVGVAP